jgi:hypothetical protein
MRQKQNSSSSHLSIVPDTVRLHCKGTQGENTTRHSSVKLLAALLSDACSSTAHRYLSSRACGMKDPDRHGRPHLRQRRPPEARLPSTQAPLACGATCGAALSEETRRRKARKAATTRRHSTTQHRDTLKQHAMQAQCPSTATHCCTRAGTDIQHYSFGRLTCS